MYPRCIDAADSAHSLSGFLLLSTGLLSSAACSRKSALPLPLPTAQLGVMADGEMLVVKVSTEFCESVHNMHRGSLFCVLNYA